MKYEPLFGAHNTPFSHASNFFDFYISKGLIDLDPSNSWAKQTYEYIRPYI